MKLLATFIMRAIAGLRKAVSYHPEKHYMRGPGPKWRETHDG